MSFHVFISYRRKDAPSPVLAEWLYNLLVAELGIGTVFFDRSELEEGDDFPEVLRAAVEGASVFVPLIGPTWNPIAADGSRRLHNSRDFVRMEVATWLNCCEHDNKRFTVPLLFDGASFPLQSELPECLHTLTKFNANRIESPYQSSLSSITNTIVRRIDEIDSLPPEEKWILKQIGLVLPADKHTIRELGIQLKGHFPDLSSAPTSARTLARALYLIGPSALPYLSPLALHDTGTESLLRLLATHWIRPDTARELYDVFSESTARGHTAALECEYSEFTPQKSLLKASHDICGWPTVDVNPPDEPEEIIQQIHEQLVQMFHLRFPQRRSKQRAIAVLPHEERAKICDLLKTCGSLPIVLNVDHLMALDQALIGKIQDAFPPLHILIATYDMEGLKTLSRFTPISRPAASAADEESAFRAYEEALRRIRNRLKERRL